MSNPVSYSRIPIRILLVDDDEDDIFLFSEAVKIIPISTELQIAESGSKALKTLQSMGIYLPDLIFLDLHMPLMNGTELLKILKTNDLYRHIPCIILTAFPYASYIKEAYDLGANLYVIKPIDPNKLINIIEQLIDLDWKDYFPPESDLFLFK